MSASGTRVYVGRVPMDARDKDIEKFFKGYGRLREILMKNGYTFVVSLAEKLSCLQTLSVMEKYIPSQV